MNINAPNLNHLWAGLIVEECVRNGADTFFLTYGSRNTPLLLAIAEHPRARNVFHFDERGAAFMALGYAKASGKPGVLVCTSGTAAANYLPALVEASQAGVPLLVLTADRPPELLACGANQAIDQRKIYGEYVRAYFELPCPDTTAPAAFVLTTVDEALYRATNGDAGPVHINCPFREPLAPAPDGRDGAAWLTPVARWLESEAPHTQRPRPQRMFAPGTLELLAESIKNATQGLVIAGMLDSKEQAIAARMIATYLGWPLAADVTSGLRFHANENTVTSLDSLLLSETFRATFRPDCVMHIGGPIVSKRIQAFLEQTRPNYIVATPAPRRRNPGHLACIQLEWTPSELLSLLDYCFSEDTAAPPEMSTQANDLVALSRRADAEADAWLAEQSGITEIAIARAVSRLKWGALFLGNSMPVRDMDMYAANEDEFLCPAFANRGASGIDGNIATIAGIALGDGPVTAVLGDLAVLHDLNSLALLREVSVPVALVVINNDGGGIFSFLPVADYPEHFEACFGAAHGYSFASAATMFGLRYASPMTMDEFEQALLESRNHPGATIIEVHTSRNENLRLHREMQQRIAAIIDAI